MKTTLDLESYVVNRRTLVQWGEVDKRKVFAQRLRLDGADTKATPVCR
jgi:hypothetical protein